MKDETSLEKINSYVLDILKCANRTTKVISSSFVTVTHNVDQWVLSYACTRCKTPTRVPTIGREEIFNKRIRKGHECVSQLRIQPLSSSLYIQPYGRLPYKDLYTALSMLTHRWNVSLETFSWSH